MLLCLVVVLSLCVTVLLCLVVVLSLCVTVLFCLAVVVSVYCSAGWLLCHCVVLSGCNFDILLFSLAVVVSLCCSVRVAGCCVTAFFCPCS